MRKLNAAVIGLGNIGLLYEFDQRRLSPSTHSMAYQLNPMIQLEAVMDIRKEQQIALQNLGIETNFYTSRAELLRCHQLDIVSICTPPECHLSDILAVAEQSAAKIIFCEKPIVRDLKEATTLLGYIKDKHICIVPNISRRWDKGMAEIQNVLISGSYGTLEKIHVRYTRGIYNTGAHLFDLLHMWCGRMETVRVLKRVYTSSELTDEPSFTFAFHSENHVDGFFEAFDDRNYYIFEIDLYLTAGKIEVRDSGSEIVYYKVGSHHCFSGFCELQQEKKCCNLPNNNAMENAVQNLTDVLNGRAQPKCRLEDAIYPLYVAKALEMSYQSGKAERVEMKDV